MTERLYYSNSYLHSFTAQVVEQLEVAGRPAVILDRSVFYPLGGGQPADRGTLGDVDVIDVVERESDGEVLHVLSRPLGSSEVSGVIDAVRRFDHMQQHSGQHILSQACLQVAQAETVSFHMSDDWREGASTIDVNRSDLPDETIERVENLANSIVVGNLPVVARFVSNEELALIPLRKPPQVDGAIRIVEIEGFDWSACGGTHVARTGEVGLIKITKVERRGSDTRVEFRCGRRALIDYQRKHKMISAVAGELTVGYWELDQALARLQAENKSTRKQLVEAEARLQQSEIRELLDAAEPREGYRLIVHAWSGHDMGYLRRVASELVGQPKVVALLGATGNTTALVFARSKDLPFDLSALIKAAAVRVGGKGGGSKDLAQAGGPPSTDDQLKATLAWAAGELSNDQ